MTAGIISWGVYLPYWRLQRSAIGASLGGPSGRGSRSVASYDEDTTTMGVEASRRALAALDGTRPEDLFFATPAPAYLDKTNATAIHGALELPTWAGAYDMVGSVRSSVGALRAARSVAGEHRAVAVLSDLRTGMAGGSEERDSGDGAVAVVFGGPDDTAVAEWVAHAGTTAEFLDRWRTPGEFDSKVWEERFGQEVYVPLVHQAWADALKSAGVVATDVDPGAVACARANGVDARAFQRPPSAPRSGRSLVFVGHLAYPPNSDAVSWFIRKILPLLLAQDPHLVFEVVGGGAPAALRALEGQRGLRLTGFVPDTRPYLWSAAVSVCPVRTGAGRQNKLLEAFAAGTPCVATPLAAAGAEAEHGRHLLVAEDPAAFAEAVLRLYREPALGRRLARQAKGLLGKHYRWEANARVLERTMTRAVGRPLW